MPGFFFTDVYSSTSAATYDFATSRRVAAALLLSLIFLLLFVVAAVFLLSDVCCVVVAMPTCAFLLQRKDDTGIFFAIISNINEYLNISLFAAFANAFSSLSFIVFILCIVICSNCFMR